MSTASRPADFDHDRQLRVIRRALARHSFCVLATSSAQNRPHAVGLLYAAVDLSLYFVMGQDTVKVRNIRANPKVAVSVPVRTFPFAPPMAVQFQGTAELLTPQDPRLVELRAAGRLRKITGLGAGDAPGAVFVRVTPDRRISSYGLGIPVLQLVRDITLGARSVEVPAP